MFGGYASGGGGDDDVGTSEYDDLERYPPIVENVWVTQLEDPDENGNIIMEIQYDTVTNLPTLLPISNGSFSVTFADDGHAPDSVANDRIYSAYISDDINSFVSQVENWESNIAAKGYLIEWTGHTGEMEADDLPIFDSDAFNNFQRTELDKRLITGLDCEMDLIKQNSLFITHLDVVEDPARTYNIITGAGNPTGAWTFGEMIKNMANQSVTGVSAKTFLKKWIYHWESPQNINGQNVEERDLLFLYIIEPWLTHIPGSGTVSQSNWENVWDNTPENDLLKYAPFRLMAIVNRLDLRGSSAYTSTNKFMGETRFIFTLIAPHDLDAGGLDSYAGFPPCFLDQANPNPSGGFADWEGMNVIIEYRNPHLNICELQNFAADWLNLSDYTLGSPNYNYKLQQITDQVTIANTAPNMPNGSTLAQIRTNERIFQQLPGTFQWEATFWEMRQFEINAQTNLLEQVPVTATPVNSTNYAQNLTNNYPSTNSTNVDGLHDWSFSLPQRVRIALGTHNMPLTFPNTSTPLLAGAAQLDAEFYQYLDLNWDYPNDYYDNILMFNSGNHHDYKYEKQIRQQLSLNTCQGCHAGENKTLFTQMRPLGYGETAEYWTTVPDNVERKLDTRFISSFGETTIDPIAQTSKANYPTPPSTDQYITKLSAFLTGRSYTGTIGNGTFNDDFVDDPVTGKDDPLDHTMDGLYQIMDPSNHTQNMSFGLLVPRKEKYYGFNELQRRKDDLCQFLDAICVTTSPTTGILIAIEQNMLNPEGH